MEYIEISIETYDKSKMEILSAFLSDLGFESFVEEKNQFKAYINKKEFNEHDLKNILNKHDLKNKYKIKTIQNENWNEKWEKSFKPVIIENKCLIKAAFHNINKSYKYEIIINPKMSFGTGHHETTYLMIKAMLVCNFINKKVFDIGCGTGILSILASLMGAYSVFSIDIDEWSVINIKENIALNKLNNIKFLQATVNEINNKNADLLLANINRNVLLKEIPAYAKKLNNNGILILSGFYTEDFKLINKIATENNLIQEKKYEKNNWLALTFKKAV